MYLVDFRTNTIHDLTCPKYECQLQKIPKEQTKKVYTMETVKRMCDQDHQPRFMGCQWCLPDYYIFDMNAIF